MHTRNTFTFLQALLFICTATLVSCHHKTGSSYNEKKKLAATAPGDAEFMAASYSEGLYATKLAEEAVTRSTSPDTKLLATNVINENSAFIQQLKTLAAKKAVTIQFDITNDHRKSWLSLIKQKGWNFDETFTSLISGEYDQRIEKYKNFITKTSDPDLKPLFQQNLVRFTDTYSSSQTLTGLIQARTRDSSTHSIARRGLK